MTLMWRTFWLGALALGCFLVLAFVLVHGTG